MFKTVLFAIACLPVIGYLLLPFFLLLVKTVKGKFKDAPEVDKPSLDFAVIVTAYEETGLVPRAVKSILDTGYQNMIVYVVADNCDISDLTFSDSRVVVLMPEQVLASNVRSHQYAIRNFIRPHEFLTIIDSDNRVASTYFTEVSRWLYAGFDAVQGLRQPNNLDTELARLDAVRDIYYHYYDGQLLFSLGSSATLSGSGMAFRVSLYKDCFRNRDVSGAGFDKLLQAAIVGLGKRIAFAPTAVVFDQKTSKPGQLVNQRARWLNTWFKYAELGFGLVFRGFKQFDINGLLFGIVLLRPPLFILLAAGIIALFLSFWIDFLISLLLVVSLSIFILCFVFPLWLTKADVQIVRSLVAAPRFIFLQFVSLTKIRRANSRSVATKHVYDQGEYGEK